MLNTEREFSLPFARILHSGNVFFISGTTITFIWADIPAIIPCFESSNTRQFSGETFNLLAVDIKT